jgi:hypothetical protein
VNNSAEKILYRKAALIFEELGFLMPRPEKVGFFQKECSSAAVPFKGPFSGCLLVTVSPGLLSLLSSNMLGEAGRTSTFLEQDALREIANVICGNALPAIYGFELVFQLDAPKLLDRPDMLLQGSEFREELQVRIAFNAGHAAVALLVEHGASLIPAC